MLRKLACLAPLLPYALGCTITTYSAEPPPPPPPPQQGSGPATAPQAKEPQGKAPPPRWRRPANPSTPVGNQNAPKVTAVTPFGGGTPAPFRGLAFVVPDGTTKLPNLTNQVPFATLYTDRFDIKSQPFQAGFPGALAGQVEWFAIRYDGRFSLPTDGTWQFKVVSDDGAILYVDGVKVVDNDGAHTAEPKTGQASLKAGAHTLRLDYFQATGPVALQVFLVVGGQDQILIGTK